MMSLFIPSISLVASGCNWPCLSTFSFSPPPSPPFSQPRVHSRHPFCPTPSPLRRCVLLPPRRRSPPCYPPRLPAQPLAHRHPPPLQNFRLMRFFQPRASSCVVRHFSTHPYGQRRCHLRCRVQTPRGQPQVPPSPSASVPLWKVFSAAAVVVLPRTPPTSLRSAPPPPRRLRRLRLRCRRLLPSCHPRPRAGEVPPPVVVFVPVGVLPFPSF
mmetsp:Transcript_15077/g.38006  ORF Transcript_15077/g.38006 Transcript_15077/m.38006 type:complete len:213 (-) Transcript_15077:265-903(-)